MKQWLTGSKSPGLIVLEHELSKDSTAAFIAAYPLMQENNWKLVSLATLMGKNVTYQNAADNVSPVTKVNLVDAKNGAAAVAPAASAAASAKSSSASAASATASVIHFEFFQFVPADARTDKRQTQRAEQLGPALHRPAQRAERALLSRSGQRDRRRC
jgi:hypothetical protein